MKLSNSIFNKGAIVVSGVTLLMALGCSGSSSMRAQHAMTTAMKAMTEPQVSVSPSPVPYERKVKVTISGSGFAPNQELELLIPIGGIPSDISSMVKPAPKTNAKGEFSTVWVLDNEIRGKLLEPTQYTLEISNTKGEVLAKAPFILQKVEKKK